MFIVWCIPLYALVIPSSDITILTQQEQQILNSQGIDNPLRQWASNMVAPEGGTALEGIVWAWDNIATHDTAQTRVLDVIKNIVNYALGMVALVALIYLIYHGFLILTAAGDDTQYKKGIWGIKFAAIALGGIGISRLLVSMIFRLINYLITW